MLHVWVAESGMGTICQLRNVKAFFAFLNGQQVFTAHFVKSILGELFSFCARMHLVHIPNFSSNISAENGVVTLNAAI